MYGTCFLRKHIEMEFEISNVNSKKKYLGIIREILGIKLFCSESFQVTYFKLWFEWKLEDMHFCLIKKYLP